MKKDLAVKESYYTPSLDNGDSGTLQDAIVSNLEGIEVSIFDLETIKIPSAGATTWSVVSIDGEETLSEITGVIIGTQVARAYWAQPIEESGGTPPDCYSNDGLLGEGTPGGRCAECPYAQFGSDGKRGQACKSILRLFLLRPGALLPALVPLPPTSIKPAKAYLLGLAARGIQAKQSVVGISLEKEKSRDNITYSRAKFRLIDRLTPQQTEFVAGLAAAIMPTLKRSKAHQDLQE